MKQSYLEQLLLSLIKLEKLPLPVEECCLVEGRKWRCDFVWLLDQPLMTGCLAVKGFVVEVDGGVYSNGRHTRGSGFTSDCEKQNEVSLRGFFFLRVTAAHIRSGWAIQWIKEMMKKLGMI